MTAPAPWRLGLRRGWSMVFTSRVAHRAAVVARPEQIFAPAILVDIDMEFREQNRASAFQALRLGLKRRHVFDPLWSLDSSHRDFEGVHAAPARNGNGPRATLGMGGVRTPREVPPAKLNAAGEREWEPRIKFDLFTSPQPPIACLCTIKDAA